MSNQNNNSSAQGGQMSTQGEPMPTQDGLKPTQDEQASAQGGLKPEQSNQGEVQNITPLSNQEEKTTHQESEINQIPPFNTENSSQNQQNMAKFSQNKDSQPQSEQTNIILDNYTPDFNAAKSENSGDSNGPSSNSEEKGSRLGTVITIILMIVIAVGIWYTNKDNKELTNNNTDNIAVVVDNTKEEGEVKIIDNNSEKLVNNEETFKITAFYNKIGSNECENVASLIREAEKKYDSDVINTVRGLLTPLNSDELSQGWLSSIPDQTYLKSVTIKDGLAKATFSAALNQVAGSCRVLAIRSQIEKTLLQFPYIKSVTICIDDNCRPDEILQP